MKNSLTKDTSGGGVGFVGLLTILFVALKLTGSITWSWWWVLSPVWISGLVIVVIVAIVLIVYVARRRY